MECAKGRRSDRRVSGMLRSAEGREQHLGMWRVRGKGWGVNVLKRRRVTLCFDGLSMTPISSDV